jgi:hypothetical protein
MICTNCKNNWSVDEGKALGNCPVCGADTLLMLNAQLSKTSVDAVLQNIILAHGVEILNNKKRLSAMIGDLFHNDKRVKRLLQMAIQHEIPAKLAGLYNSRPVDLSMQRSAFRIQVQDNTDLKDDAINDMFQYWELALNPPKLLSTKAEPKDGRWIDEYGVKYSSNRRKLILRTISINSYSIFAGTEVICEYAFFDCSDLINITFPPSINYIGKQAFYNCSGLKKISLHDSVKSIGDFAFSGCSSLTSIIIPSSVKSIGDGAFSGCDGLNCVTIPSSVTSIMQSPFGSCENLKTIEVENASEHFKSIDGVLFDIGLQTIICFPEGKAKLEKTYSIPSSVTSIGKSAFYGCEGLTSITIPSSVILIGENAFSWCEFLRSINIPSSVTSIGDRAFFYCSNLAKIILPESIESIGVEAFYRCDGITSIYIPDSVTFIGARAFKECRNLKQILINKGNDFLKGICLEIWYDEMIREI